MTMPSSTSQSSLVECGGCTTSSLGPLIEVVAFMKMIGSFGSGMPASAAWVGVIEANANELADADQRYPVTLHAGHDRQRLDVDLLQSLLPCRRKHRFVDVGDMFGEVTPTCPLRRPFPASQIPFLP